MTTYVGLRAEISTLLQDPSQNTFTPSMLQAIVQQGMAEIGRIAPQQFQQDITPTADTLTYTLRQDVFSSPVPELEVIRVELWDTTVSPNRPVKKIMPIAGEYDNWSDNGWRMWQGVLGLPRWVPQYIGTDTANYLIRVWGYSPYPILVSDATAIPLSHSQEQALLTYARVEALHLLNASRELFSQWQTRSGNTDMTPAGLMNALNIAMEDWRRKSRAIMVLREGPG